MSISTHVQSFYPRSIEKFSDGTLCYCCDNKSNMYLIDKSGDIKEIKLGVCVCDIAIHPTTDVLYSYNFRLRGQTEYFVVENNYVLNNSTNEC